MTSGFRIHWFGKSSISQNTKVTHTQCASGIFNLNQKFHELLCYWGLYINETVQNQSRKTSVIGLPKFTTANMGRKRHKQESPWNF